MSSTVTINCKTLDDALNLLRDHEVKNNVRYSVSTASKGFGCISLHNAKTIFWQDKPNILYARQCFSGVPFASLGQKQFDCQFGKDYKKKSREKNRKQDSDHGSYAKGSKFLLQPSKKTGCPAKCVIREICWFPSYKVDEIPSKDVKRQILSDILCRIRQDHELQYEREFIVCLPSKEDHAGHPLDEVQPEQVDSRIASKIKDLCRNGVRSVMEMKRHLHGFVQQICDPMPHPCNRRFYPTDKIISNHMYTSDKMGVANDQENLQKMDTFLFVHQSVEQKRLMGRYGLMLFMDATYRTTLFDLPLFFLCVKTNVDFQIVASFIVENESATAIEEALHILKLHNPNWSPCYFLTDFDESEIKALETEFTGVKVLLCDFHREQSWGRWVKKKENRVEKIEEVLSLLRKLSTADTPMKFDERVAELKSSDHWKNKKLKFYMEKIWLPVKERWSSAFRNDNRICATTNNGVECQHRVFKQSYLNRKTTNTVTHMLQILLEEFLPGRYKRYIDENRRSSGLFRTYNEKVPCFLQGRPRAFIKHCMARIQFCPDLEKQEVQAHDGKFYIKEGLKHFQVHLGHETEPPSCTCYDWRKHRMPCRHHFKVLTEEGVIHWDRLSPLCRDSPYFTLDQDVLHPKYNAKDDHIEYEANSLEEDRGNLSLEHQPHDTEQQPYATEQQSNDTDQQPHDTKQQPHDTEQQPHDTEQQPHDTKQQPHDTEQQPNDTEQQPHDTEQQSNDTDQQPHDTEQQPHDTKQQPHDTKQQSNDTEQQPNATEQQPNDTGSQGGNGTLVKTLQMSCRETLKMISSLTYITAEPELLNELKKGLDNLYENMSSKVPMEKSMRKRLIPLKRRKAFKKFARRSGSKASALKKQRTTAVTLDDSSEGCVQVDGIFPSPVEQKDLKPEGYLLNTEIVDNLEPAEVCREPDSRMDLEIEKFQAMKIDLLTKLVNKLWSLDTDLNTPVAKPYGIVVTDTDIRSLKPGGWLTDNILDCYLSMLCTELKEQDPNLKVVHFVSSLMSAIASGTYKMNPKRGFKHKLCDSDTIIGIYGRASHWTLIIVDIRSCTVFFYNPTGENKEEMDMIIRNWQNFIKDYNAVCNQNITTKWMISTKAHTFQKDSHNCGIFCILIAEKHLREESGMEQLSPDVLKECRRRVAEKVLLFEDYIMDCCPQCGFALEDENKMQCGQCHRFYHFKQYCIGESVADMKDEEKQFICKLCKLNFWPQIHNYEPSERLSENTHQWTNKVEILRKLQENNDADPDMQLIDKVIPSSPVFSPRRLRQVPKQKRRSSFMYPEIFKKTRDEDNIYCNCKQPYKKSETMWCCDRCDQWFHPRCIGRDDKEHAPRKETAFLCESCLNEELKNWPIQAFADIICAPTDDEDANEDEFFINTEDVFKHMRTAYKRCWYLVRVEGMNSVLPWMKRHQDFIKQEGFVRSHGFGEALFSQQAMFTINLNLMQRFQRKKNSSSIYSMHYTIPVMANRKAKKILDESSGQSENYIKKVLLKESMIVIMQEVMGKDYEDIEHELKKTEAPTMTKANKLIMNYLITDRGNFCEGNKRHPT